jgi:hypothetical protein
MGFRGYTSNSSIQNTSIIFVFVLDGSLRSANDRHGDLTKARQYGWTTQVDTFHGYVQCFDRLRKLKVIP